MRPFDNDFLNASASRRWGLVLLMLILAGLMLALPLRPWLKSSVPEVFGKDLGHQAASSVVENSGKVSLIRVLEDRDEVQQNVFHTVVTDVGSGKQLAEPQRFVLSKTSPNDRPQLRYFADGNLYLILRSRMLLRYDPGALQFVDITPELLQRFAAQLGPGISVIDMEPVGWRSALDVTANDGQRWMLHWPGGEIWPYGQADEIYAKQVQGYTHWQRIYAYLPVDGDASRRRLLTQYEARAEPGKALRTFRFELNPYTGGEKDGPGPLVEGGAYWVTRHWAQNLGLLKVRPLQPETLRFHAEVLAENSSRVLLAYSSGPQSNEGRVLQLLDKASEQVVWSRTVAQLPQLDDRNGGAYLGVTALNQGFFINLYGNDPALLIDNNGQILHDFTGNTAGERR